MVLTAVMMLLVRPTGLAQASSTPDRGSTAAPTGPMPRVQVEYFGTEHGYAIGMEQIVLLCVVRNVGGVPLPENFLRMHCMPVAGLDYTTGDTTPNLPALAPDQSVAFRWRFAPTNAEAPMIAAAFVESAGSPGPAQSMGSADVNIAFAVVPRFNALPTFGAPIAGADAAPQVGVMNSNAWLAGNRVAVRVLSTPRGEPLLLLAGRSGTIWQTAATSLPLARVRTSESGQIPWWHPFRWQQTRTYADKNEAVLTLLGSIGSLWRAELQFVVHRDTGAVEGKLRLIARRAVRLQAVQLPRLLTSGSDPYSHRADGTPVVLHDAPAILPEEARIATVHQGALTFGIAWPSGAALSGWNWSRLSTGDGDTTVQLGVRCAGPEPGQEVSAGTLLEFPFRLFAFGPSDTVRDALHFALP